MVIHDLDLSTLDKDLAGFKPNLYVKNLRFKLPFDHCKNSKLTLGSTQRLHGLN